MPKLYFKVVERVSGILDFGHRKRSMLIFTRPFDPGSKHPFLVD